MPLKRALVVVAKGFCMGAADVVPGVSGGTMAFILGIYTRFIDAIKSFDLVWAKACLRLDWRIAFNRPDFSFLLPLLAGIFAAIFFFTHVVPLPQLLVSHPELVYGVFFGLIAGSIIILLAEFRPLSIRDAVPLVSGLGIGLIVVTAIPGTTPDAWWYVFIAGALAICAMVVPGISGSFVLLILGKYAYVLDALGNLKFEIIIPFAAGAAVGLISFTRLLSWTLHHFERQSLATISGVLIASLWGIWPFQERVYIVVRGKSRLVESSPLLPELTTQALLVAVCAACGFVAVIGLQRLAANAGRQQR